MPASAANPRAAHDRGALDWVGRRQLQPLSAAGAWTHFWWLSQLYPDAHGSAALQIIEQPTSPQVYPPAQAGRFP